MPAPAGRQSRRAGVPADHRGEPAVTGANGRRYDARSRLALAAHVTGHRRAVFTADRAASFLASMTSSRPSPRGWQSLTAGFPPRGRARRETSVSIIDHGPDSPPNQHGSNPRAFAAAARGHSRRLFDDAAVLSGPDGQSAGPRALRGSPARHRRPCSRTLVSRVGHAKRRRSPEYVRSLVSRTRSCGRADRRVGGRLSRTIRTVGNPRYVRGGMRTSRIFIQRCAWRDRTLLPLVACPVNRSSHRSCRELLSPGEPVIHRLSRSG